MAVEGAKRKLTAILSADVKGYSRLMAKDEVETAHRLKTYRRLIALRIREHRGRVVDTPGDNILAEFPSALDATRCAVDIQRALKDKNADLPADYRMAFRIGIHLGDVIVDGPRISGDGVNIAARLEKLSESGGICISAAVYEQIQNKLDLEYLDIGEQQVKNIAKPVYVYGVLMDSARAINFIRLKRIGLKRLQWVSLVIILVMVIAVVWYQYLRRFSQSEVAESQTASIASEKPVIAVLPFDNMSGDPEQEYFSDGMTEEIIAKLSLNPALAVIARNSTFHYKGKGIRVKQVRQELGARYVVEGSARKSGTNVRITAQLIDATTENHLWAETYSRELKDVFALQDEISERIVAALGVKGWEAEQERAWRAKAESLNAYDLSMRGWWHYYRFSKEDNSKAQEMFRRTIDLDPTIALGHVGLGQSYVMDHHYGFGADPKLLDRALAAAQDALKIDRSEPRIYLLLADIYWRKGNWEQALVEIEKAIDRNQSFTEAIFSKGFILRNLRRYDESIVYFEKAIKLDPRDLELPLLSLSIAYRNVGRYSDSLDSINRTISHTADSSQPGRAFCEMAITYLDQWATQQNENPNALDRALAMAQESVDLDEGSPLNHSVLFRAYLNSKQYDLAISEAEKVIAIMPESLTHSFPAYSLLGSAYNATGRSSKAIALAEKSLQLSPEHEGSLFVLGQAYRLSNRYRKAEIALKKILSFTGVFKWKYLAHKELAILYAESGQEEKAKAQAEKVLTLVPHFSTDIWGERNPMKDRKQVKRDMAALRKVGLK